MSTFFISDLHLDPLRPEITHIFLNFLATQAVNADALYILGDFFETWIGDDNQSTLIHSVKSALRSLSQQVPVYIMRGNRDFLLGTQFMHQTGCQLLPDPTIINLYGTPTLLMHGDTLCIDDVPYLEFRTKAHNVRNQRIFLTLPLLIRKTIARILRMLSKQRSNRTNQIFIDANLEEIKRLMKLYQVKLLIHGHTHRPSIQYFDPAKDTTCRIVMSDWEESGNVLICDSNGERRLVDLP